ncbi:MAG TPA: hypothetical protein DCY07_04785 [Rhodospirillaceae bacterium]|nr:hypothetical protein [Rhodospirillaceae bacterium]
MDTTTQILSGLFAVAIVIMIAPRIMSMNRGKMLQNLALWMAIFLGLAVAYKTVGPGKDALPLTGLEQPAPTQAGESDKPDAPQETLKEEDGFSPPRE